MREGKNSNYEVYALNDILYYDFACIQVKWQMKGL